MSTKLRSSACALDTRCSIGITEAFASSPRERTSMRSRVPSTSRPASRCTLPRAVMRELSPTFTSLVALTSASPPIEPAAARPPVFTCGATLTVASVRAENTTSPIASMVAPLPRLTSVRYGCASIGSPKNWLSPPPMMPVIGSAPARNLESAPAPAIAP